MSYEFLEHPSDIIVLAKGETFEKALEDAALGMFQHMGAPEAGEQDAFDLDFSAPNMEQLVVQLLTEIIAECEIRPVTPRRMEVTGCRFPVSSLGFPVSGEQDTEHGTLDTVSGEQFSVSVRIFGEKKVPENIIKAVTYNSLKVEKQDDAWIIQVLFDI